MYYINYTSIHINVLYNLDPFNLEPNKLGQITSGLTVCERTFGGKPFPKGITQAIAERWVLKTTQIAF